MLKDYVDARLPQLFVDFAHLLVPVGFPVVDNIVGSKVEALVHLVFVAGGGNHGAVVQLGNLDAHHADARASTHDKHKLPWLYLGAADEHVPRCHAHHRDCRRVLKRDIVCDFRDVDFWQVGVLRKPAPERACLKSPDQPVFAVVFPAGGARVAYPAAHV